jgi:amidase
MFCPAGHYLRLKTMNLNALENTTIVQLAKAQDAGTLSAVDLTRTYLERIERLDTTYRSILVRNPRALEIAAALDAERNQSGSRGPLHGIPILVKDNLDTGDEMPTTAGSLALADTHAGSDSTVVAKLRAAGAIILGKTNLSEWANFRSTRSSTGWSSVGGQTGNAYDPLRTPGGSSSGSGVAVALGFCAAAIGTETDGSVVIPAAMNGIVGIKPTVGLVSRAGIVPISASQDTAGPMARTVEDAALLLDAIAGPDPRDESTMNASTAIGSFGANLDQATLRGARIGVARDYMGYHEGMDRKLAEALEQIIKAGGTIIDPVALPTDEELRRHEGVVLETEFKAGIEAYLATREDNHNLRTLADLIDFNNANADKVMPYFSQEKFDASFARGDLSSPEYLEAKVQAKRLAGADGIDAALAQHDLHAIVAPTTSPAWLNDWINGDNRKGGCSAPAAIAGYTHITVPMGFVAHLPVGISFFAGAGHERRLIGLTHAFEQRTGHRKAPAV